MAYATETRILRKKTCEPVDRFEKKTLRIINGPVREDNGSGANVKTQNYVEGLPLSSHIKM